MICGSGGCPNGHSDCYTIELNGVEGDYTFTFDSTDTAIAFGSDLVANVLNVNFNPADATFV